MLYQGLNPNSQNSGAQVLVPTDDYALALDQPKAADLNKIQQDIVARKARQEIRERQAQQERAEKELEGCTFAPQLMTKKRKPRTNNYVQSTVIPEKK